jgi:sugar-specific transcriptional regulator TrmB
VSLDHALDLLKSVGMSGYEAKAYTTLLGAGTALNGYEVAKRSGVPRSTVYETLAKLVVRGAAFEVKSPANGVSYVALPSDALIGRLERDMTETIGGLATALPAIAAASTARVVEHLQGHDQVVGRAQEVIEGAVDVLFVSLWPAEFDRLASALDAATSRGVDAWTITFGDVDHPVGKSFVHHFSEPEVVLDRLGCRIFTVVADRAAVLMGGIEGDQMWGMWSDDAAVALLAAEYVRHDIALQIIGARLGEFGLDRFWQTDASLEELRRSSGVVAKRSAS